MLNSQAILAEAVGEIRGEIKVLNVTLIAMDKRQGHYEILLERVETLESQLKGGFK